MPFSQEACNRRHNRIWQVGWGVGGMLVASLLGAVGWAMAMNGNVAAFHGQQAEFNRHTTTTLDRIDKKVDRLWRDNGGGE